MLEDSGCFKSINKKITDAINYIWHISYMVMEASCVSLKCCSWFDNKLCFMGKLKSDIITLKSSECLNHCAFDSSY
jgi:hypothetical protein